MTTVRTPSAAAVRIKVPMLPGSEMLANTTPGPVSSWLNGEDGMPNTAKIPLGVTAADILAITASDTQAIASDCSMFGGKGPSSST
mmetsp:Transcript_3905/g.6814  ORF Transcript_3905/g.6814 Transcript_3905/m.6814 type:complete len:86 (+) Transcript_3905:67-324(+)